MFGKFLNLIKKMFLITMLLMSTCISFLPINSLLKINKFYAVLTVLIYIFLIFVLYKGIKKININNRYISLIVFVLIILIGLSLRIYTDSIMKTIPESDFATPHAVYDLKDTGIFDKRDSTADNSSYQVYYSVFPAWFTYMKVISTIYDIFGKNLIYIKILNWILYIFTSVTLYYTCKNCFSKKTGILATLLFTFLPSHIIYSNITTPDHITIFLITLWLFIWSKQIENRRINNYNKLILFSLLNIICICAINLFKPLSIFGILVFVSVEILCFGDLYCRNKNDTKHFLNNLVYCVSFIILCFLFIKIENKILYKVVEDNINTDVVDSTGLYMLWGFSVNENGEYDSSPADRIYVEVLKKNNNDTKKTINEINLIAKKQFKTNIKHLPIILLKKFYIAYYNEQGMFLWGNYSGNANYDAYISNKYNKDFLYTANGYMFMLFLLISISLVKEMKKEKQNDMIFVSSLIIIGYTCILVFGGVQPRYKTLIFGPICFLAASSLEYRKKE